VRLFLGLDAVTDAVDDRVSIRLERPLPSIRIAKVGDQAASSEWEAVPMYQAEVWGREFIPTEQLAWDIKNAWTSAEKQVFPDLGAVVHGRWIVQDPMTLPANDKDADNTGMARFLVTVAFRLTGVIDG
jgi:hypothetical protein